MRKFTFKRNWRWIFFFLATFLLPGVATTQNATLTPCDTCMTLPFSEYWYMGSFSYNNWSLDNPTGNWQISSQYGNGAPTAMFDWNPVQTNYSSSLVSYTFHFNSRAKQENFIWLEYDLFLDDQTQNGQEYLDVEVWNNGNWFKVDSSVNTGDINWVKRRINIVQYALDTTFRIRFRAHGSSSANINHWLVDNIMLSYQVICEEPKNLQVEAEVCDVHLTWTYDSKAITNNSKNFQLIGFVVYRDGEQISDTIAPTILQYDDYGLTTGQHIYMTRACYNGCEAFSDIDTVFVTCSQSLPFNENWIGGFSTYNWTFEPSQGNWTISSVNGNPIPAVSFNEYPEVYDYYYALTSPYIEGFIDTTVSMLKLKFDLSLLSFLFSGTEKLTIQAGNDTLWIQIAQFTNVADIPWTRYVYDLTPIAYNYRFKVRFLAEGVDSYKIKNWCIDNINVYQTETCTITGIVSDIAGIPIQGAIVTIDTLSCATNADGRYFLTLDSGTYNIVCTATTYKSHIFHNHIIIPNDTLNILLLKDQCLPPKNLYADLQATYGNPFDVKLIWDPPMGCGSNEWIHWDSGENYDGIGLTSGGTFDVAIHFNPDQLYNYIGAYLETIKFFPRGNNTSYAIKIWTGENASNLLVDLPVNNLIIDDWTEIDLPSPVFIDGTQELWLGYSCNHPIGDYPAGCDAGPAVAGYGDMISIDGTTWELLSSYGLDCNWNIQGYVANTKGGKQEEILSAITQKTEYKKVSPFAKGNLPKQKQSASKSLNGYEVYRDGVKLNDGLLTNLFYYDIGLPANGVYLYVVNAVYDSCIVGTDAIIVSCWCGVNENNESSIKIIPNPASGYVTITLPEGFTTLQLMNMLGQVVIQRNLTQTEVTLDISGLKPGTYLIRSSNDKQETVQQKLMINKH